MSETMEHIGERKELLSALDMERTQIALEMIGEIDFGSVAKALDEKGWSVEAIEGVKPHYQLFLAAMKLNPSDVFAPPQAVDEMWHAHQGTDTYATDIGMVFGQLPNHNAGLGSPGSGTESDLAQAGQLTSTFYRQCYVLGLVSEPAIPDELGDFALCGGGGGVPPPPSILAA